MAKTISVKQAQKFDQDAQKKLGIPSVILMENAGRGVAEEALRLIKGSGPVVIVCGTGNNGGDGLVAARHLLNAGLRVEVMIVGKLSKLKPDPKTNYAILKRIGAAGPACRQAGFTRRLPQRASLIIDALFGLGLNADIREPYASIIDRINDHKAPVLSVDVPSGLDADTGRRLGRAVKAKRTVTFVAAKKGFFKSDGPKYCGRIVVRDIGIV
ncbi:MAG: NAD(P)H-hydrate epimerase [Candidatus Saganbacteria bacterium]|nr:NAD(P)H-hydrate epimerase [Candidatus Saganbacteria bacterium]